MPEPLKITEIWAWVIVHGDGSEGVPATSEVLDGWIAPLLGADEARVRSLEPHARKIALLSGEKLKLMRFTRGEVVDDA